MSLAAAKSEWETWWSDLETKLAPALKGRALFGQAARKSIAEAERIAGGLELNDSQKAQLVQHGLEMSMIALSTNPRFEKQRKG